MTVKAPNPYKSPQPTQAYLFQLAARIPGINPLDFSKRYNYASGRVLGMFQYGGRTGHYGFPALIEPTSKLTIAEQNPVRRIRSGEIILGKKKLVLLTGLVEPIRG